MVCKNKKYIKNRNALSIDISDFEEKKVDLLAENDVTSENLIKFFNKNVKKRQIFKIFIHRKTPNLVKTTKLKILKSFRIIRVNFNYRFSSIFENLDKKNFRDFVLKHDTQKSFPTQIPKKKETNWIVPHINL